MKVRFRQEKMGYCTVLMWANLFNQGALINFIGNERFFGCSQKEEEELVNVILPKNILPRHVAYINQAYPGFTAREVFDVVSNPPEGDLKEGYCTFYTLSVRRITSIYHSVAIVSVNGILYYLDPYNENWILLNSELDLSGRFIDCCSIQRLVDVDTETYQMFDVGYFNYPFLEEEY